MLVVTFIDCFKLTVTFCCHVYVCYCLFCLFVRMSLESIKGNLLTYVLTYLLAWLINVFVLFRVYWQK